MSQSRWLIEHSVSLISQCLRLSLILMSISGVWSVLEVSDVQPPCLDLGHELSTLLKITLAAQTQQYCLRSECTLHTGQSQEFHHVPENPMAAVETSEL